jgi:23S rRNA pseudouridine2605 synthase
VKVDGKRVLGEEQAYVLLHKPKGTICTLDDPEHRPTVMELVKGVKARLFPVGRLDFDTTGALLLTNDGELANLLMHPRHRFTKTYLAKVKGIPTEERLDRLRRGVNIEGVRTAPAEARLVAVKEKNSLVELVLREGRNRQVKRMFLEVGHPVIRLHRPAYAFLSLEGLEPGQWRSLGLDEVKRLRAAAARSGEGGDPGPAAGFEQRIARPLREPRPVTDRSPRPEAREGARPGNHGKPRTPRAGKKPFVRDPAKPYPSRDSAREGARPGGYAKPSSARPGGKPYPSRDGAPREGGRPGAYAKPAGARPGGKPYPPRDGAPREGGFRSGAPREGGPREGGFRSGPPREGGPRDGAPSGPKPRKLGPRESGPRGPQAGPRSGKPSGPRGSAKPSGPRNSKPSGPRKRPS